ncbi:hypothetical protein XO42_15220, partial [Listeria monocytogenes]|nr:hypothetical protein [Listeria monocytogenes]
VANGYSDNIFTELFISEIVHTEDSFLLKLYYKFNFATEPLKPTLWTKFHNITLPLFICQLEFSTTL